MNKTFSRLLTIALVFVITACSMGAPAPTATPTATNTPVPPTATVTPSPTLTPTPVPMASVNEAVDCYAGPSEQYDKVASLETGAEIRVVGQSDDDTFWIVAIENGSECWLTKENATMIIGDTAALAQVAPPPTPTLSPPAAPSEITLGYACPTQIRRDFWGNKMILVLPTFYLNWKDNATNEDGYVVYKESDEYKRLDPDSTEFSDTAGWSIQNYEGVTELYSVAAFNAAGESERVHVYVLLKCPR